MKTCLVVDDSSVIRKVARRAIAEIDDFVANGLQPFDESGCAQGRGRLFAPWAETCGAGRRADEGNLVRLTDDFDRQSALLVKR